MGTIRDAYDKALVSYCTSCCRFDEDSFGELVAHAFDEPGVAGGGRLEETLVLVVGSMRDEQAGAMPGLDGGRVHAEMVGDLVEGEHPEGAEALRVVGWLMSAA